MAFLVPDDVSTNKIKKFTQSGISEQSSKIIIWKYLFFVLISKFIINVARKELDSEKSWPKEIISIRKFLIENNEIEDLKTLEKIKKIATKIQPDSLSIKLSAIIDFGIGKNKKVTENLDITDKINRLEEFLFKTLNLPNFKDKNFYIYIDKIDDMWTNDESSNQTVIGLLLAAHHLNTKFRSIKCITFLRTDIYHVLEFHDKDKFHSSELELRWDENSLSELFYERVSQILRHDNLEIDKKDINQLIFNGEIEKKSILRYIISRTLFRPRELIQFCNLSLDIAKKINHHKIEPDDVLEAEETYSKWKLGDLAREYKTNYPFLNDLIVVFGKHFEFNVPEFDREQFSNKFSIIKDKLKDKHDDIANFTTDIILAILYNIGFLGTTRSNNVVFKYSDPNTIGNLDNIFLVHPAFWKALGINHQNKKKNVLSTDKITEPSEKQSTEENKRAIKEKKKQKSNKDKIKSTKIIAGSDEVITDSEISELSKIILEFEMLSSEIENIFLQVGKAHLVRTIGYLNQAIMIFRKISDYIDLNFTDKKNDNYSKSDIGYYLKKEKNLAKAFKLIEISISQLENLNQKAIKLDHYSTNIQDLIKNLSTNLNQLYKILISEYEYDMFLIARMDEN